jgi:hypothetical protein
MAWTSDSRAVIVRTVVTAAGDKSELWLVPAAGGSPRKLDVDVNGMAKTLRSAISLHRDGQRLAFTSGERVSEVWMMEHFLPKSSAK